MALPKCSNSSSKITQVSINVKARPCVVLVVNNSYTHNVSIENRRHVKVYEVVVASWADDSAAKLDGKHRSLRTPWKVRIHCVDAGDRNMVDALVTKGKDVAYKQAKIRTTVSLYDASQKDPNTKGWIGPKEWADDPDYYVEAP